MSQSSILPSSIVFYAFLRCTHFTTCSTWFQWFAKLVLCLASRTNRVRGDSSSSSSHPFHHWQLVLPRCIFFGGNSAFKVVRDGRNRNRRGEIGVKWVKVSWLQILWRRAGSAQDSLNQRSFEIFHVTFEVFTSQRLKHCFLQSTLCVWRPGLTTWVEPSKPCNVGQPCHWLSMVRIANFAA